MKIGLLLALRALGTRLGYAAPELVMLRARRDHIRLVKP